LFSIILKIFFKNDIEVFVLDIYSYIGLPISILFIWLILIIPSQLFLIYKIAKFVYEYKFIILKLNKTGLIDLKYIRFKYLIGKGIYLLIINFNKKRYIKF
jgi:hypothetical protein